MFLIEESSRKKIFVIWTLDCCRLTRLVLKGAYLRPWLAALPGQRLVADLYETTSTFIQSVFLFFFKKNVLFACLQLQLPGLLLVVDGAALPVVVAALCLLHKYKRKRRKHS